MTTKKPPPPSYRPTAGFPSVTEAVRHFAAEGKTPDEIATLTGSAVATVRRLIRKARMQRIGRAARGLSLPQRIKVKQAYVAYLDFMVIALKSDRDALHQICRFTHVNKEPALSPEQKVDEAEPARAGLVDTPKPEPPTYDATVPPRTGSAARKDAGLVAQAPELIPAFLPKREPEPPVIVTKPKNTTTYDELTGAAQVTLRATNGEWLNMNGSGTTRVKAHRYLGTPAQAKKMRLASKFATGMRIESASPSKGDRK